MNKRTIPFGYKYENGFIVVHQTEAETLKKICQMYITGCSLLEISAELNKCKIEYMPGITAWNKSRLMRIMLDERYLGSDQYPKILDEEILNQVHNTKENRNTQKDVDRSADIYSISIPVLCPVCGSRLARKNNTRRKYHHNWICDNPQCTYRVCLSDDAIPAQITNLLNQVICNPTTINSVPELTMTGNSQVIQQIREIDYALLTGNYEKAELLQKMMACLSIQYKTINHEIYAAHRMRTAFENASILTHYSADFAKRTIKQIALNIDSTMVLELISGQKIGLEEKGNGSH